MRRSLPHQIVVSIDLAVEEEDSRTSQEFMFRMRLTSRPQQAPCRDDAGASRNDLFGILIIILTAMIFGTNVVAATAACAWRCQVP